MVTAGGRRIRPEAEFVGVMSLDDLASPGRDGVKPWAKRNSHTFAVGPGSIAHNS